MNKEEILRERDRIMRKKEINDLIEKAFKKHFDRMTIPIMDIPKIYDRARVRILVGENSDQVLHSISLEYKK